MITDFGKDFHPEFLGYISIEESTCWISFIESKDKGKGNFSRLLEELKQKYDCIKIPTPFPLMVTIAEKKGFILTKEYFPAPFDEWNEILVWRKEKK